MLFLGSAPAPGDLCQVISLLCALASSRAAPSRPAGSPGGMLPRSPAARGAADGEADVSQPVRCCWEGGWEGCFLLGGVSSFHLPFFTPFLFRDGEERKNCTEISPRKGDKYGACEL